MQWCVAQLMQYISFQLHFKLCVVHSIIQSFFASHRQTARLARASMFPLEPALPVENHCSWLTTLIKHGHSSIALPSSSTFITSALKRSYPLSCHLTAFFQAKEIDGLLLQLGEPQKFSASIPFNLLFLNTFSQVKIPETVFTELVLYFPWSDSNKCSIWCRLLPWNKVFTLTCCFTSFTANIFIHDSSEKLQNNVKTSKTHTLFRCKAKKSGFIPSFDQPSILHS